MDNLYRIAIAGQDMAECNQFRDTLEGEPYRIEIIDVPNFNSFPCDTRSYDLCIVCLPKGFPSGDTTPVMVAPVEPGSVIYVMSSPTEKQRHWAYAHGAIDVAVRPQSRNEFKFRVERAILSRSQHVQSIVSEDTLLDLLKSLVNAGTSSVEPVSDPSMPAGIAYPEVEFVVGRSPAVTECLEQLAIEGLLSRTLTHRVQTCPACKDYRLNFREVCPHCRSAGVTMGEVLRHLDCGHTGSVESFRKDSELVCPKCSQVLKQLGADYEKPGDHRRCVHCESIFQQPLAEVQCVRCANIFRPDEIVARPVYRYELTPLVHDAIAEGRIAGISLSSVLKNKYTGLYNRQYFEHEVMREFARSTRYNMPYSMLFIRIEQFDELRKKHPDRLDEYASAVFAALSHKLRTLDTACVWDRDTLGVLLPGTHDLGAQVVIQRMHASVAELENLRSLQEPRISVGMVSNKEKFNSYTDAMEAALAKISQPA
ncbi:MAG: hypothetical protein AMXMBFR84_29510 [Candidatus Hydrogenedentota bacterium]